MRTRAEARTENLGQRKGIHFAELLEMWPCYAEWFAEIEFSQKILVRNTKVAPVLVELAKGTVIPYEAENVIPWGGIL